MKTLFSFGINLKFAPDNGWRASIDYQTMEHAQPTCIEGSIGLRYFDLDLTKVIDRTLSAAKAIGVVIEEGPATRPCIYVEGGGTAPSVILPSNWRELVQQQCERLGWEFIYQVDAPAPQA